MPYCLVLEETKAWIKSRGLVPFRNEQKNGAASSFSIPGSIRFWLKK